jgi:hypothetical protein
MLACKEQGSPRSARVSDPVYHKMNDPLTAKGSVPRAGFEPASLSISPLIFVPAGHNRQINVSIAAFPPDFVRQRHYH